jgi:phage-related protein
MNEELKIIIKAVTKDAVKPIQDVKKELNGLTSSGKSAGSGIGKTMKGIGIAATAAVAAITAVVAALVKLGKAAVEFNKEYSKLTTAFQAVGASAQTAEETYRGFYRFLGDSGKATEASAHVAKLATSHESLAEWVNISQGVYATFGDSLPIEGLTEAANETLRTGQVTGVLADALNWAGVSEDAFNEQLAKTSSYEERELLLRSTLNGLYSDAARIYEENNKALLDYNDSQARMTAATAAAGQACIPLLTALNNLGTSIMNALAPVLDAIVPYIASFVNWLAKGVETVLAFFSALTGKSAAIKTASEIGGAAKGMSSAAKGADALASGLDDVGAAAKEAKRHLQGFDELNVLKDDSSSGGGSAGGGGGYTAPSGGYFDNSSFEAEITEGEDTMAKFIEGLQEKFEQLKVMFEPTIEAWSAAFQQIAAAWEESKVHFENGAQSILSALKTVGTYILKDFIPNIVNSFSTNFAPIFADVVSSVLKESAKTFEWYGALFEDVTNNIIIPTMQLFEKITTETFAAIGESWSKYGGELVRQVEAACQNIRDFFTQLYEEFIKPVWDKVLEVLERVWTNGLQPLVERVSDFVLRVATLLLKLYNETIAPIVEWLLTYIYPIIRDVIGNVLDILGDMLINISNIIGSVLDIFEGLITFLVGVFTLDFQMAWEGIKMFFQGIWDAMCEIVDLAWNSIRLILEPVGTFFSSLWQQIQNIFAPVAQWFSTLWTSAWNGIKNAWSSVGQWFSNLWTNIKNTFSSVGTWFKNIFSTAWTNIKNVFSNWASFFGGLWDKIKNTFSGLGTILGDAIGGAVKTGINKIISWIESTINSAIGLINSAISLINKLPGVSVGYISKLSLPRLAEGGIVDSATIAMIGEAGKEAVLPLENNTEWMDKLADKIAARNGGQTKVVLQLNDRELGWATIDAINGITKQTGGLQLAL